MNSPDDHAAHSPNGYDERAETDALHITADAYQEQVERKKRLDTIAAGERACFARVYYNDANCLTAARHTERPRHQTQANGSDASHPFGLASAPHTYRLRKARPEGLPTQGESLFE